MTNTKQVDTATDGAYAYSAPLLDGTVQPLSAWRGKVLLIVNVASRCGFTPQYAGLEDLWRRHASAGLVVLGFPCNQFGHQEPGTSSDIRSFCSLNYGVSFPLFARIDVNGPNAHPLYRYLKREQRGIAGTTAIKWNFTKFLIDREGRPAERFGPLARPAQIEPHVASLLGASA